MIESEHFPILLGIVFLLATLDWATVTKNPASRLRYLTKPAVLLALSIWFWLNTGWQGFSIWFGLGLFFSLIGDITLMIPRNWFLFGLAAFQVAHVCYIISLNPTVPSFPPIAILITILLIAWALVFYRILRGGLANIPGNRRLRLGVGLYSIVITLMLISSFLMSFRPDVKLIHALLITAGASLFYTSDSLLGYDRFVHKVIFGRALVRITYHLGQIAMASGMVLILASPK